GSSCLREGRRGISVRGRRGADDGRSGSGTQAERTVRSRTGPTCTGGTLGPGVGDAGGGVRERDGLFRRRKWRRSVARVGRSVPATVIRTPTRGDAQSRTRCRLI